MKQTIPNLNKGEVRVSIEGTIEDGVVSRNKEMFFLELGMLCLKYNLVWERES